MSKKECIFKADRLDSVGEVIGSSVNSFVKRDKSSGLSISSEKEEEIEIIPESLKMKLYGAWFLLDEIVKL